MLRREFYILSILVRLIASTAIVPAILVGGMLSIPTTCQCGAEHPHTHSAFGMAGHHHGEQRTTTGGPDLEYNRAGTDGVTVQNPSGLTAPALTAIQTSTSDVPTLPGVATTGDHTLIPDGLQSVPNVPPPQA